MRLMSICNPHKLDSPVSSNQLLLLYCSPIGIWLARYNNLHLILTPLRCFSTVNFFSFSSSVVTLCFVNSEWSQINNIYTIVHIVYLVSFVCFMSLFIWTKILSSYFVLILNIQDQSYLFNFAICSIHLSK